MKNYVRYHVWEWLLCVAMAAALLLNFSQGFYIPERIADSVPLAFLGTGTCLLFFFAGNYNKITMLCFPPLCLVGIVIFFLWLRSRGVDIGTGETADDIYIYPMGAAMISLSVFALSRGRAGIAALFIIGSCLHGVIDFLAYEVKPWCTAMFVFSCICLYHLRQYRVSAMRSSTVQPDFTRFCGTAAAASLVGLAAALLLFFAVVRQLNPPTLDIHLISRTLRYEILERIGVTKNYPVPDEMLRSLPGDERNVPANQPGAGEDDNPPAPASAPDSGFNAPDRGAAPSSGADNYASVSYPRKTLSYIIAILAATTLVCAALFVLFHALRRRREARLLALGKEDLVLTLYPFFLKTFKYIGLPRPASQTALEYLDANAERLSRYTLDQFDFAEMTKAYLGTRFGGLPVDHDIYSDYLAFYPAFTENYRRLEGRARCLLRLSWTGY